MKAYKYKLRMNAQFQVACERTLDLCRELYNAGLEERREAYQKQKQSLTYHDQRAQLPEIKAAREDVAHVYSQVLQDVLRRLEKTFTAFFRRVKAGDTPGYPRFKGKYRYHSFCYPQSGFRLEGDKLHLSKIGSCRLRLSRPVEGKMKTCTIRREADGWYVIFAVEESQSHWFAKTGETVGIDVGIENFATLSTGEAIENPKYYWKAERELQKAQRKVSRRANKCSKRRRKAVQLLQKHHQKVRRQRQDFHHKTANQLLREFDEIAVEDLHIKGLVKNHHLAKSISDASWGTFIEILSNKAASAGRRVWKVAAQFTSQDCSQCGNRVKKSLSVREHRCIGCGFVAHRDHNAALNIKGRAGLSGMAVVGLPREPRISTYTC